MVVVGGLRGNWGQGGSSNGACLSEGERSRCGHTYEEIIFRQSFSCSSDRIQLLVWLFAFVNRPSGSEVFFFVHVK